MKKLALAVALLGLLVAGQGAYAVIGTVDDVPAATLLLPYFEVDLGAQAQMGLAFANFASNTAMIVTFDGEVRYDVPFDGDVHLRALARAGLYGLPVGDLSLMCDINGATLYSQNVERALNQSVPEEDLDFILTGYSQFERPMSRAQRRGYDHAVVDIDWTIAERFARRT